MKAPVIKATTNYGIFKRIQSNRDINKAHLRKLTKAIQTKNLLYLFPIVVNGDMEIIDGQHRLTVAKELGLPIYYLIDNDITKADIAMVNNNRKSWASKDFIDFYAKEGVKEYKRLKYLLENFKGLTIMGAVRLMDENSLSYYTGGNMTNNLKAGNINSGHYELAIAICELCKHLAKDREYCIKPPFMLDVKNAVVRSGIDHDQAISKIRRTKHVLPVRLDVGDTCLWKLKDIVEPPKPKKEIDLEEVKRQQSKA